MKLPLITKPWWTTESFATNEASTGVFNCLLEQKPGGGWLLSKRPGVQELCNPGTNKPGQGCYYSEKLDALFFVSDGKLWRYDSNSITVNFVGSGIHATNTVVFAEGQDLDSTAVIYIADGERLKYTKGTTLTTVADATAPLNSSYVVWFSNRFVANKVGTPYFYATGVNTATQLWDNYYWSSAFNPFAAEIKGDDILGLHNFSGELWVSGEEGIEIWQDDGVTPLTTVRTAFIEAGAVAPKSMTRIDLACYALVKFQGELMVCRFEGRNPIPISQSISRPLNELKEVTDAIGFHVFADGASFYVISFPAENTTWAWDIKGEYWARWGTWDMEVGVDNVFFGQYSAYASKWGKYFIQSRNDGRIYAFSRSHYGDGNTPIHSVYYSPALDHGSLGRKRCNSLSFYINPSPGGVEEDKTIAIKWNDDGRREWSNEVNVSFNQTQLKRNGASLDRMGMYYNRRYCLAMTGFANAVIGDFEVDMTRLS